MIRVTWGRCQLQVGGMDRVDRAIGRVFNHVTIFVITISGKEFLTAVAVVRFLVRGLVFNI